MLVGENGIITQARRADELTTQAQQKEAIELAVTSVQAQGTLELDKRKLETALQSQLGDTEYTLIENEDGSFLLQIAERNYYIDSTGEVIAEENMIAIGSAEELKAFRDEVNNGNTYEGKYVYLTGNITLNSSEQWEPIGVYPMENSTPDAETNKPFSGIFDGKGYEVNGIYINTTDKAQGLFGLVSNGKIINLDLGENNSITGGAATAGIVGYLYNGTEISNCYNKANVKAVGESMVGGIAGQVTNDCAIKNSYNEGTINADNRVGGIAGNIGNNSIIDSCYNIGDILGTANNSATGGIAGDVQLNSKVSNCYNIGIVTGNNITGGIVGYLRSTGGKVENAYYLEGTVNGVNDSEKQGGVVEITSNELKNLAITLGEAFKQDTNNINQGYPILAWQ